MNGSSAKSGAGVGIAAAGIGAAGGNAASENAADGNEEAAKVSLGWVGGIDGDFDGASK